MSTDLAASSTSTAWEAEIEAAWYVLAILLRIGRPVSIEEIVAMCRLFPASREYLICLCRIPNSPLFLSDGGYITVSRRVEVTFRDFVVGGVSQILPKVVIRRKAEKVRDSGEVYSEHFSRKRKETYPLPDPKRRALIGLENNRTLGPEPLVGGFIHSIFTLQAYHDIFDVLKQYSTETSITITRPASRTVEEIMQPIPLLEYHDSARCMPATTINDAYSRSAPRASLSSEVPWIRRKNYTEKIIVSDESVGELVVDDSEDNHDQSRAITTVRSSPDLSSIPLPSGNATVTPTKLEENCPKRNEVANENNNKNKRAASFDRKLSLNKLKKTQNIRIPKKGNKEEASADLKKQEKASSKFPQFESFIVEEEEGSGGYGTVYKARRKGDGKTFAIKCPHPKAHPHHIHNELKMLERFGGKCFIIKYEGCFKSENSECFVLEHVEHDRPEVLKKEMNVSELRWYGYCMFRALASLHKQGVVHRDVKPGNFLFSCKQNKGYLIDFNLALDLNHKPQSNSKSHPSMRKSTDRSPLSKSTDRSPPTWRPSPSSSLSKTRKPAMKLLSPDKERRSKHGEGSGVTSAREATSTRTPSGDRLREPVPCRGRRELISLAQEVMQSPGKISGVIPVQRKRIAAPLGRAERHLGFLSPMPLLSGGIPLSAAPRSSDKRQKMEGPCVGTKGFRAPEVLLKSVHQSCKVDVWSAGVTLLYLMIGKSPFAGDPEQNMKEIAKLRGSEDIWEVAKLHNRESSFPMELLEVEWLKRVKLEEWCEKNTKKGKEWTERVPPEMWDLVDRCLAVNPRLRISAEEALEHEFFAPCRESLRRQRLLRLTTTNV